MQLKDILRDPWVLVLLIFTGILAVFYLVLDPTQGFGKDGANAAYLGACVFSIIVLIVVIRFYGMRGFEGKSWLLLMIGIAVWTAGEFIWTYYYYVNGEAPFPSIADYLYIAGYFFFFAAFIVKLKNTQLEISLMKFAVIGVLLALIAAPAFVYVYEPVHKDIGALDGDGRRLADSEEPAYISFTVADEATANATSVVSEDGAVDVAPDASIALDVGGRADISSAEENLYLYDEEGNEVAYTVSWNGTVATIVPDELLAAGGWYEAYIYSVSTEQYVITILYPVLDLVFITAVLLLLAVLPTNLNMSGGWFLLAAGVFATAAADLYYYSAIYRGIYPTWTDFPFALFYILIALGAIYQKKLHESFM